MAQIDRDRCVPKRTEFGSGVFPLRTLRYGIEKRARDVVALQSFEGLSAGTPRVVQDRILPRCSEGL
jgi:hypothetical protein